MAKARETEETGDKEDKEQGDRGPRREKEKVGTAGKIWTRIHLNCETKEL
jgi:hypothetical protein